MSPHSILARAAADGISDPSYAYDLTPQRAVQFILETVDTCMIGRRLHVWVNEAPAFEAFVEGRGFARITRLHGHDAHQSLVDAPLPGQEAALEALLCDIAKEAERIRIDQTPLPEEAAGLYGCVRAERLMPTAHAPQGRDVSGDLVAAYHPEFGWRSQPEAADTENLIAWASQHLSTPEGMTDRLCGEDLLLLSGPGDVVLALNAAGRAALLKGPGIALYAQARLALLDCLGDD